jgi:glutamine cyclotransferase
MNLLKISIAAFSLIFFLFFTGCVNEKSNNSYVPGENVSKKASAPLTYLFEKPLANQTFIAGDRIEIKVKKSTDSISADSIIFYLDGIACAKITPGLTEAFTETGSNSPGKKRLKMTAFFPGDKMESTSVPLRFLSDIEPKQYTYRVTGTFPHDIKAYTQGFEYHNGYFYEGTGQLGESSIRKTVPGTGDFIKFRNISSELFGEGITLLDGKIYQVTYTSQVGFIYDAESFEQLQKFFYQNREGWGLCNNGSEIIMSDGTNILYFIDPQYFTVNRKIEVCDHVSEVDSLNELEYINGTIYSNRYMTNEIVMIDPETGKVTGKIDMKGILKPEDRHARIDVLNGIAWDREQSRIFVTGKNWPKIFRVEFIEK